MSTALGAGGFTAGAAAPTAPPLVVLRLTAEARMPDDPKVS